MNQKENNLLEDLGFSSCYEAPYHELNVSFTDKLKGEYRSLGLILSEILSDVSSHNFIYNPTRTKNKIITSYDTGDAGYSLTTRQENYQSLIYDIRAKTIDGIKNIEYSKYTDYQNLEDIIRLLPTPWCDATIQKPYSIKYNDIVTTKTYGPCIRYHLDPNNPIWLISIKTFGGECYHLKNQIMDNFSQWIIE